MTTTTRETTRHHFDWQVPDWRVDYDGPEFDVLIWFNYTAGAAPEIVYEGSSPVGTTEELALIDKALCDEIIRRAKGWFETPDGYDEALRVVAYDQGMPR